MDRLLLIYNPTSGTGRVSAGLSELVDEFTKAGWLVSAYPTQGKGDAARAAQELGPEFERVVCAGGDGTLSETVTGMMALEHPPLLGYIPFGSTNDCAVNLDLPKLPRQAAAIAAGQGVPRASDIGKLNGQPFVYVAAFGAFTQVAYDTPQDLKNTFGHLAYIVAGIASLPTIAPYHMRGGYDGQGLEDDFYFGMVSNAYSIGGLRLPKRRRWCWTTGCLRWTSSKSRSASRTWRTAFRGSLPSPRGWPGLGSTSRPPIWSSPARSPSPGPSTGSTAAVRR